MIKLVAGAGPIDIRSLRFLIVDDDDDQRYLVARTLARMGVERIVEASSGRRALKVLDHAGPMVDIVVTDLHMPDIDGMELVRRVGERKLPVSLILLSALDGALLGSAATMTQAYGVRIIGAIEKPATREKFRTVLEHYRPASAAPQVEAGVPFEPDPDLVLSGIAAGQFEPFFPPVIRTLPLASLVAVCPSRAGERAVVVDQVSAVVSKS